MKFAVAFMFGCLLFFLFVSSVYYLEVNLFFDTHDDTDVSNLQQINGIVDESLAKDYLDMRTINDFFSQKLKFQPPDPAMFQNASQLIIGNGFPCEVHHVTTSDGYILGMQRIPQPSKNRLPVLLMHGLLSSSDCFLTNLVNESLAYILYNEGYDVWLGNVRGNTYSTNHIKLSPNDREFWKFSFDEMGKYDIPAMVDYVLDQTEHEQLMYIGHSQGTTSLFAAAISHGPKFANKIKKFIALAPAGIVRHMKSILRYFSYESKEMAFIFNLFRDGEFLPRQGLVNKLVEKLCPEEPKICENVLFLLTGNDLSNLNESRIPVYTAHNPAGTSVRNMLHWAQLTEIDGMRYYDYGNYLENWLHYGMIHAPFYELSGFSIETYAFCGGKDQLVVSEDCDHLLSIFPNVQQAYFVQNFTHVDFIWAVNAKLMVYDDVIRALVG